MLSCLVRYGISPSNANSIVARRSVSLHWARRSTGFRVAEIHSLRPMQQHDETEIEVKQTCDAALREPLRFVSEERKETRSIRLNRQPSRIVRLTAPFQRKGNQL